MFVENFSVLCRAEYFQAKGGFFFFRLQQNRGWRLDEQSLSAPASRSSVVEQNYCESMRHRSDTLGGIVDALATDAGKRFGFLVSGNEIGENGTDARKTICRLISSVPVLLKNKIMVERAF